MSTLTRGATIRAPDPTIMVCGSGAFFQHSRRSRSKVLRRRIYSAKIPHPLKAEHM